MYLLEERSQSVQLVYYYCMGIHRDLTPIMASKHQNEPFFENSQHPSPVEKLLTKPLKELSVDKLTVKPVNTTGRTISTPSDQRTPSGIVRGACPETRQKLADSLVAEERTEHLGSVRELLFIPLAIRHEAQFYTNAHFVPS